MLGWYSFDAVDNFRIFLELLFTIIVIYDSFILVTGVLI